MRMLLHRFFGGINPYHKFLKNYCNGEVIDVGANKGVYSKSFIKHGAKRVFAFEPVGNLKLRECDKVYKVALGNGNKKIKFNCYKDSEQNSVLEVNETGKYEIEVQQKKLDDYAFSNISLIKIDCQGMDYEVLLGGIETIKRFKPAILVEVWEEGLNRRGYSKQDVDILLSNLGYTGEKVYDCGTYYDMFYKIKEQP